MEFCRCSEGEARSALFHLWLSSYGIITVIVHGRHSYTSTNCNAELSRKGVFLW